MLQSLNSSWDLIAINFQTQAHTKDLDIDEFLEKLCAFSRLQKRREAPKLAKEAKDKNLALKVEKALHLMHDEGGLSVEDSRDADLAFITKGIKRFWRGKSNNNNSGGSNFGGTLTMKVTDDTICFNCGDKGHISRMCSKPKKEFP